MRNAWRSAVLFCVVWCGCTVADDSVRGGSGDGEQKPSIHDAPEVSAVPVAPEARDSSVSVQPHAAAAASDVPDSVSGCLTTEEVCDGRDNDCDDEVDEPSADDVAFCEGQRWGGVCDTYPRAVTCELQPDGSWRSWCRFVPSDDRYGEERCDSLDNDCNGATDEVFRTGGCFVGEGACRRYGEMFCQSDWANACSDASGMTLEPGFPIDESCNDVDDDCDGETDDGCPEPECHTDDDCGVGGGCGCEGGNWWCTLQTNTCLINRTCARTESVTPCEFGCGVEGCVECMDACCEPQPPSIAWSANSPTGVQTGGVGREIARFDVGNPSDPLGEQPTLDFHEIVLEFGGTLPALTYDREIVVYNIDRSVRYGALTVPAGTDPHGPDGWFATFAIPLAGLFLDIGQTRTLVVTFDTTGAGGRATPDLLTIDMESEGLEWSNSGSTVRHRGAAGLPIDVRTLLFY